MTLLLTLWELKVEEGSLAMFLSKNDENSCINISEMPKQFRQCNFCTKNSVTDPELVIFRANENLKSAINIPSETLSYICEEHFDVSDVKPHGNTKRLREGAVPFIFPRQEAVLKDHDYLKTTPLDLVRNSCFGVEGGCAMCIL